MPYTQIPPYFTWIQYISPMRYGYIALAKNEFAGLQVGVRSGGRAGGRSGSCASMHQPCLASSTMVLQQSLHRIMTNCCTDVPISG